MVNCISEDYQQVDSLFSVPSRSNRSPPAEPILYSSRSTPSLLRGFETLDIASILFLFFHV